MSDISDRMALAAQLGVTYSGKRDVYDACGWKKNLVFNDYFNHYKRSNVAGTIVDILPEECFSTLPIIKENESKTETEFEEKFNEMQKRLHLFDNFVKVDKLAGIHKYAVLFIGFDDGKKPDAEVSKATDILYVQPFLETNAKIVELESDPKNKRFGLPLFYELKFSSTTEMTSVSTSMKVHYTRILHVAENTIETRYLGTPRLERVFNNIDNIIKISGGGAEGAWRGAFPGLGLIMDKDAKITDEMRAAMQDEVDEYEHNLSRVMKLKGIDPKMLNNQPADNRGQLEVELKLIAFTVGIPKRILEGSERGELSSGQDRSRYETKIEARRTKYISPTLIAPFLDILIASGVLPAVDYSINWTPIGEMSPTEKSENNKRRTETLKIYSESLASQTIISPKDFLIEFMGYDLKKADETLKNGLDQYIAEETEVDNDVEDSGAENV